MTRAGEAVGLLLAPAALLGGPPALLLPASLFLPEATHLRFSSLDRGRRGPVRLLGLLTGFLVPPGDREEFRSCLQRLLRDPELRVQMGAAGRARYERDFTLEGMLERTVRVYSSVTEQFAVQLPHRAPAAGRSLP